MKACEFASLGEDREVKCGACFISWIIQVSHVLYLLNMCCVNNQILFALISFFKDDTYPKVMKQLYILEDLSVWMTVTSIK